MPSYYQYLLFTVSAFFSEILLPHVQSCVECYKSNWKVIRYNHRSLSSSVSSRSNLSKTLSVTPKQEFEVDFQGLPSESSSELGILY